MGMDIGEAIQSRGQRADSASRMVVLMNVWVFTLMLLETVVALVISPLLVLLWLVVTRWPLAKIARHLIWLYGRFWIWIVSPFVRFRLVGADHRQLDRPCVFVLNHLSFFDVFFTSALPVFDVAIYVRSWPFKLAWYAPFMRLGGYVDVERLSWEEIVAKTERILREGHSIMLFPQGHRSRDGRLGRFYSGAFKLAVQFNVPIVPLCITGTDRLLPRGRRWLSPANVRMQCLGPIEMAAFQGETGHIRLRKYVKELMGACLAGNRS
ncbi:MAG: 1-acyl-sn-glycerol-3-phosphate acyltransferase [Sedimentisphaerales bacterium]|nr:1-acyl-sn-glycerol-3-phosphate acyltransferase [Sedimentisphaerales bacterium]